MTSNVGSQVIAASRRPARRSEAYEAMKRQVTDALRLQFRPEFLNRVDEVIVFHALTEADLAAIVELLVADLQRRLADQDLTLELTPAARALIAREGTDPTFGARPLKRTIQRLVENPLARALIEGRFKPGQTDLGRCGSAGDHARVLGRRRIRRGRGRGAARRAPTRTDEAEPVGAGGGGSRRRRSVLDLPDTEPDRGDGGSARTSADELAFRRGGRAAQGAARGPARAARGADADPRRRRALEGRPLTAWPPPGRPRVLVLIAPDPGRRGAGHAHRADELRRPSLGRGLVSRRRCRSGRRGPRRNGPARGQRGDRARRRGDRPARGRRARAVLDPGQQLPGDAGRRARGSAPGLAPDPREVARVIEAPLAAFLPDAPITTIERDVREWRIRYGAYALEELGEGPAVWGATARILGQLGAVLGGAPLVAPPRPLRRTDVLRLDVAVVGFFIFTLLGPLGAATSRRGSSTHRQCRHGRAAGGGISAPALAAAVGSAVGLALSLRFTAGSLLDSFVGAWPENRSLVTNPRWSLMNLNSRFARKGGDEIQDEARSGSAARSAGSARRPVRCCSPGWRSRCGRRPTRGRSGESGPATARRSTGSGRVSRWWPGHRRVDPGHPRRRGVVDIRRAGGPDGGARGRRRGGARRAEHRRRARTRRWPPLTLSG